MSNVDRGVPRVGLHWPPAIAALIATRFSAAARLLVGPVLLFACLGIGTPVATGQNFFIDRSTLESWTFQRYGTAAEARTQLGAEVDLRIRTLVRSMPLSEAQQDRLRLAAMGDIKRLFDRFDSMCDTVDAMGLKRQDINEVFQLTTPLQQQLQRGLFEDGSLFRKTLQGILTPEQSAAKAAADRRRQQQAVHVTTKALIASLSRMVPMTTKQRDSLTEMLVEASKNDRVDGQYGMTVIQYRLSKIDPARLEPLFDEAQLKFLRSMSDQAIGMEAFLIQQGLITAAEAGGEEPAGERGVQP